MNEAVKLEIVRALGLWAASLDALPGCFLDRFSAGLKEKESLQKAHLQTLLQVHSAFSLFLLINANYLKSNQAKKQVVSVCGVPQALRGSQELRASASALQAALAKLAADGSAKAALREAGMSAALALAYISGAIPDSAACSELSAFWALLNAPKAPLLSTAMLTRLPAEEAHIGAELAQVLLLQVSTHTAWRLLLLHHGSWHVVASCWVSFL